MKAVHRKVMTTAAASGTLLALVMTVAAGVKWN